MRERAVRERAHTPRGVGHTTAPTKVEPPAPEVAAGDELHVPVGTEHVRGGLHLTAPPVDDPYATLEAAVAPEQRDHVPLGGDVELQEAIDAGPAGGGGATTLTDLTDVTGTPGPGKSPVGDQGGSFPLTHIVTQADLDAILSSVAQVDWRPLDLQPGFAVFDADPRFATPKYRLTLNNVVHVEGMVACSPPLTGNDTGKLIATLAPDSCPDGILLFGCSALNNNCRVDVAPTGEITFEGMLMGGGEIDWFTLSAIHFSVGAAAAATVAAAAIAEVFGARGE